MAPGSHGTFTKTDHVLGPRASPNRFQKAEITPSVLSDHSTIKQKLTTER